MPVPAEVASVSSLSMITTPLDWASFALVCSPVGALELGLGTGNWTFECECEGLPLDPGFAAFRAQRPPTVRAPSPRRTAIVMPTTARDVDRDFRGW